MAVSCNNLELGRGQFRLRVSLDVPRGASLALIGPSGSGKSLFLAGLAGFDEALAGRITLAGQDVTALPPQARPVSMMFQDHNLFGHLSVAQNVGLGLHPGLRLKAADHDTVAEALAAVGLAGFDPRDPGSLSGGQQSRVALARCLVRQRPVLLLDEPFSALGPKLRREMLALVRSMTAAQETTVVFVSHDPSEAAMADYVAFVGAGADQDHANTITPPRPADAFFADPPRGLSDYL